MHVLLIDMDNRTANFNMNEVGIDVSYVVPLGYVIEVSK